MWRPPTLMPLRCEGGGGRKRECKGISCLLTTKPQCMVETRKKVGQQGIFSICGLGAAALRQLAVEISVIRIGDADMVPQQKTKQNKKTEAGFSVQMRICNCRREGEHDGSNVIISAAVLIWIRKDTRRLNGVARGISRFCGWTRGSRRRPYR